MDKTNREFYFLKLLTQYNIKYKFMDLTNMNINNTSNNEIKNMNISDSTLKKRKRTEDIINPATNYENTILFTIGRMNPPTTGHLLLIKSMIEYAIKKQLSQINIILSATVDNKTNPIPCGEKRFFLLNFMIHHLKELMKIEQPMNAVTIDNMQIKIICMDDYTNPEYGKNPILKSVQTILNDLYGYPHENDKIKMILFIGEDRENSFEWIKKSLSERNPPVYMETIGLSRPEGAMSATYIRKLATDGNFALFKEEMLKTGLNEESINELYNKIREKIIVRKGGRKTRRINRKYTPSDI